MEERELVIGAQALRRLLAAANPDAALLYLYLHSGGTQEQAAQALGYSAQRLDLAAATLQQMGLLPERAPVHLERTEAPSYSEQDLAREYATNPEFPTMVGEVQRRLGRVLSTEELKILLGIYRYLGLPVEVISMLVHYCISRSKNYGAGRMPSIRAIEKEAVRWADNGIETMEQAAAYMQQQLRRQSRVGQVAAILQLGGRRLTQAEERYISQWIAWGFDDAAIGRAYEKTCLGAGGLKWPYMHAILRSWHEQGLTTVQQIEHGDHRPTPRAAGVQQHGGALSDVEKQAVDKMLRRGLYGEG